MPHARLRPRRSQRGAHLHRHGPYPQLLSTRFPLRKTLATRRGALDLRHLRMVQRHAFERSRLRELGSGPRRRRHHRSQSADVAEHRCRSRVLALPRRLTLQRATTCSGLRSLRTSMSAGSCFGKRAQPGACRRVALVFDRKPSKVLPLCSESLQRKRDALRRNRRSRDQEGAVQTQCFVRVGERSLLVSGMLCKRASVNARVGKQYAVQTQCFVGVGERSLLVSGMLCKHSAWASVNARLVSNMLCKHSALRTLVTACVSEQYTVQTRADAVLCGRR